MCASLTNSSHGSRKCSVHRYGATTCEQVTMTLLLLLLALLMLAPAASADCVVGGGGDEGSWMQKAVPRLSGSNAFMPCALLYKENAHAAPRSAFLRRESIHPPLVLSSAQHTCSGIRNQEETLKTCRDSAGSSPRFPPLPLLMCPPAISGCRGGGVQSALRVDRPMHAWILVRWSVTGIRWCSLGQ